jgi:Restriction endonuclease S subunits
MSWPTVKLGEAAAINPPFRETVAPEESVSFVPMAAVSEVTGRIEVVTERPYQEVAKGFTPFRSGDILVAKITPCFENGKIALAEVPHPNALGSTEFHVVRADEAQIDRRFLFHFLRQPRIRTEGERKMTGSAGQRRVPKHFLESLDLPRPPLNEQQRIAAILDKADAIRQKRREAVVKLDELSQSVFLDMFGDPVTNPMKLPVRSLGSLCSVETGGTPPRSRPEYFQGSIPWVKTGEVVGRLITTTEEKITEEAVEKSNCRVYPEGTILIAMYGQGATRGRTAMLGVPATTNQACAAALLHESDCVTLLPLES